jgi:protein phosphatase
VVALSRKRRPESRELSDKSGLGIEAAILSDKGVVRELNEDTVYLEPASSRLAKALGALCIVADGMGGHAAGEVASRMAVESVRSGFYANPGSQPSDALRMALEQANIDVWERAQSDPGAAGMGCTVTAAVIHGDRLVVGHVGDSRAFRVNARGITQLTTDHSWVAEQVASGALTPEEANNHPQRNVLRRAVGPYDSVEVDVVSQTVEAGDVVVLCSDGLYTVVTELELSALAQCLSPHDAARRLVELANSRGAPDNVSVGVIRVVRRHGWWKEPLQKWAPLLVALVVSACLFAGIALAAGTAGTAAPQADDAPVATPTAVLTAAPTPQVRPTEAAPSLTGHIADNANLRTSPEVTSSSKVRAKLHTGQVVLIIKAQVGEVPDGWTSDLWYAVQVPDSGMTGFVYSGFVSLDKASRES